MGWVEGESNTTREDALNSAALLQRDGVGHGLLVTHAWHMRRAARAFESIGIRVTPAPTGFHTLDRAARMASAYLPSAQGMYFPSLALRERLASIGHGLTADTTPAPASAPAAARNSATWVSPERLV